MTKSFFKHYTHYYFQYFKNEDGKSRKFYIFARFFNNGKVCSLES